MVHLSKEELTKMQIKRIEKEIRDTPHHKGTDHHIGRLRAKIARLKDKQIADSSKKSGGGGGYGVKKQGDATVVLVGPPSVGKSTLISKLTNANSKIAPYAFTTVSVIPGMMKYKNAHIQILDVPGLIDEAHEGKGRGREVLSVARGADLLVIMVDIDSLGSIEKIKKTLEANGIRINKNPPKVRVEKKIAGGIKIQSSSKGLSKETIKTVAKEFGIVNAQIYIDEELGVEGLIDGFSKNRVYAPTICVVNKVDKKSSLKKKGKNRLYISTQKDQGLNKLKKKIWEKLRFVRVYLIKQGEKPNQDNPIVVKDAITLKELGEQLGSDFLENKTRAKIWGPGAKHPGQTVSLKKEITEGMQVRFVS